MNYSEIYVQIDGYHPSQLAYYRHELAPSEVPDLLRRAKESYLGKYRQFAQEGCSISNLLPFICATSPERFLLTGRPIPHHSQFALYIDGNTYTPEECSWDLEVNAPRIWCPRDKLHISKEETFIMPRMPLEMVRLAATDFNDYMELSFLRE